MKRIQGNQAIYKTNSGPGGISPRRSCRSIEEHEKETSQSQLHTSRSMEALRASRQLFNFTMKTKKLPDAWRKSALVPIFKRKRDI